MHARPTTKTAPPRATAPAVSYAETLSSIGAELVALGCQRASIEHPTFLHVVADDGGVLHIGTANGPWQADVYAPGAEESGEQPAHTITVDSPTHAETPEGIARFIIGTLNHTYALLAYPTQAAQDRADRQERQARGR